MSTYALKLQAARSSPAWQLALDKYPFDLQRSDRVFLTRPEREKELPIKPHRLSEVREAANSQATQAHWKAAITGRLRLLDTLKRQHGSRYRTVSLINSSRILLHLGRASVLENVGLYCDRTTGLPVIPGTAVKGVVSSWACWDGNEAQPEFTTSRTVFSSMASQILGTNPETGTDEGQQAGNLTFLGGFPETLPKLDLDIVTPHPDNGKGRITPNPFLAIAPGVIWHFPLIVRTGLPESESSDLLNQSAKWLEDVITEFGIGAKTSSGFGGFRKLTESESNDVAVRERERFEAHDAQVKEAERQKTLETLSPEERAYQTFVAGCGDWIAAARDILKTEEPHRGYILRFFRSPDGEAVLKSWPNNDKAKKRKADLKEAGL